MRSSSQLPAGSSASALNAERELCGGETRRHERLKVRTGGIKLGKCEVCVPIAGCAICPTTLPLATRLQP